MRLDRGSSVTGFVGSVSFFEEGAVGGGANGLATSAGSIPGKIHVFKSLS